MEKDVTREIKKFDFRELRSKYNNQFSGKKESEENFVVVTVMKLLNNNKFDSIDDILKYNGDNYKTFLKNNNLDNVPIHYGNCLSNEDFHSVLNQIKEYAKDKLSFDKNNVNELSFDNKEYVEYNGTVLDDSFNNKPINEQLEEKQKQSEDYQSLDHKNNIDKLMDEMNKEKREVSFENINNINRDNLNAEQKRMYDAALVTNYTDKNNAHLEISLEDGLTKDDENNIGQLKSVGSDMVLNNSNNSQNNIISIKPLSEIDETSLSNSDRVFYDAAKRYQDITGELVRLDLSKKVIITPDNVVKEIIIKDGVLVVNDDRVLFNNEPITTAEEREQEMTKEKVKTLEFPKPFSNRNIDYLAS